MLVIRTDARELLALADSHMQRHAYPQAEVVLRRAHSEALAQSNRPAVLSALRKLALCRMAVADYATAHGLLSAACLAAAFKDEELERSEQDLAENAGNMRYFTEACAVGQRIATLLRMFQPAEAEAACLRALRQVGESEAEHWYVAFLLSLYAQIKLTAQERDAAKPSLSRAVTITRQWGHRVAWLDADVVDLQKRCA